MIDDIDYTVGVQGDVFVFMWLAWLVPAGLPGVNLMPSMSEPGMCKSSVHLAFSIRVIIKAVQTMPKPPKIPPPARDGMFRAACL